MVHYLEDGVEIGGFCLIGPAPAGLFGGLVEKRYRLSRMRVRGFLSDWLGLWISVVVIHEVLSNGRHRGWELARNVLECFTGVLMSGGW